MARRIALKQLESRARTAEELRRALTKRNTPEDVIEEIVDRFRDVGLVDDAAFARALMNTRVEVQRRGGLRIRQELRQKGVPDDVVAEAMGELDRESELEAATAFAVKKARSLTGLDPMVAKRRLYGALARRGFTADVVRAAAEAATGEAVEEE